MTFTFRELEIPGVIVVEPARFTDVRGSFMELYKHSTFAAHGIPDAFVQDNYSNSGRSVLRGLHYQKPPAAQGKLVLVLTGEIFDVAVDIRRGSPTIARSTAIRLSAGNMIYIPTGFAHGYCVLSAEATVLYKTTAEYAPDLERGIRWNDPALAIQWPVTEPVLSDKDQHLPALANADL